MFLRNEGESKLNERTSLETCVPYTRSTLTYTPCGWNFERTDFCCFVDSISWIWIDTTGKSPCEEGISPYLIKFEKVPPLRGSKRWFWKPMSSRLPYLLDKHFDGRPKYKSCWVEFLNSSKENLFLDYKYILAIYKKGILITDTLHKVETLSLAVQRLLPT